MATTNPFGGPVQVKYWRVSISRGNNLRLLLADLDVPFENVDVGPHEEWPTKVKPVIESLHQNFGTLPVVILPDGKVIGQHLAALRYIARKANPSYYPTEDPEKALVVDNLLDLNQDWRVERRTAEKYEAGGRRFKVLAALENIIKSNPFHGEGPYILGEQITIADFYTFQTLNENPIAIRNEEEEKQFPELTKLWKAVGSRPRVKAALERYAKNEW